MEFLKSQFDKLLLSALFLLSSVMTIMLMCWNMETQMITWGQGLASGFVGGLLTLITGSRFTTRSTDSVTTGGKNGTTSTTTSTTATGEAKK